MADETHDGDKDGVVAAPAEPPDTTEVDARHIHGPVQPDEHRGLPWRRVLLGLVLVVAALFMVRSVWPHDLRDGFIEFDPDVALFPSAPVDAASTTVGIGRPDSLPTEAYGCPYGIGWGPESVFGNDWHTVRHDWEADGEAKSWVMSVHTVGFDDLDDYDDYFDGFYDRTKYCGWAYDGLDGSGFNSKLVELDGLPNEGFAFASDASPKNAAQGDRFGDSNPDDFDALTAVIPGPKRGQLLYFTWVGWGTEVPPSEFVASTNAMYDAARATPDPAETSDDDTVAAREIFVPYRLSEAGLEQVLGRDTGDLPLGLLWSTLCRRTGPVTDDLNIDDWPVQEYDDVTNDARDVGVSTARFDDSTRYLDAKRSALETFAPTCIDAFQHGELLIEPVALDGVPEGAAVALWHDNEAEDYSAVVTDDERQLIMVMAWDEHLKKLPVDDFVQVLNTAWTQFTADNP